ncbi:MAG: hypothetical protein WBL63_05855 [Candidatus Acidiferrum sp.]
MFKPTLGAGFGADAGNWLAAGDFTALGAAIDELWGVVRGVEGV